ncbi:MAG TPA: hypothetical protein VI653_22460 [Steroidobacteraceae bacterium]
MNLIRRITVAAAGLAIVGSFSGAVEAQTARSGGGANAQLMQQMQQLASERTSLQAQNAQMKQELDALRKERDSLKKAQQAVDLRYKSAEAALARDAAQHDSTAQELKQTKDRMQELIAKFRETIQALRQAEAERAAAQQTSAASDRDLKVCVQHNTALYKLNAEVLDRMEHQSAFTRMATLEPFTRIKKVQLENLVDDFKSRADDQVLKSSPAAHAEAASGSTAAPAQPDSKDPHR